MSSNSKDSKKDKVQVNITEIKRDDLAEKLGDSHMNILPFRSLIILLSSLSLSLILSFADQTGITVGLSQIGKDLNCETTINWAGTASLLANCVCQILFGRLSDIFGRKHVMMSCLAILCISDLACGFAQTGIQFFLFRAFAGIGNGGVSSLSMVILSDVVTLKQRGKYQGILGASVGVGNSVGPFIMAAFMQNYNWRGYYYFLCPMMAVNLVVVHILVKNKKKADGDVVFTLSQKIKQIDFTGILLATASITCLLVPVSGGGSTFAWNSPTVIALFIIGGSLFIGFLLVEWKVPVLPMIPLRLFKVPSLCLILGSNFFFGMAYFGFLYYLPYHFTIVKQKSAVGASIFILPLVLMQSVGSVISGQIISRTGHYIHVVIAGYAMWCLSNGLLIIWTHELQDWINIVILFVMGTGVGFTFQPTMVACQAQSRKCDRAVVISTRNVIRSFGGAVGIAAGSTIVSNSLLKEIGVQEAAGVVPQHYLTYLKTHIYSTIETKGLDSRQLAVVIKMYETALRNYFYILTPLIGVCLISSLFIRDRGLQSVDETAPKRDLESSASSMSQK